MDDAADDRPEVATSVRRADPAALLQDVERACARRDWAYLLELRDRCARAAEESGEQLWPVAQYVEYRLALEAPGSVAATVLRPGAARFALGPLTEVVATRHTWAELADHIDLPVIAATVAQERVLRGEDLRGDLRAHEQELDLPLVLADWEPDPPVPSYRHDQRVDAGPRDPARVWSEVPTSGASATPAPWAAPERAADRLLGHWMAESTGTVRVASFAGSASAAVAAVGTTSDAAAAGLVRLYLDEAVERLVWAGATGAVHGRRRGLAAARSGTWWLLNALAGSSWPPDAAALGDALDRMGWYAYRLEGESGWVLRLAVEAADGARTLVIDATDRADGGAERGATVGTGP